MSYSNVLGCSMEIGRPSAFQNLVNVVRVLPCAVTQGLRPSHAYRRSMAGLPFVDELFWCWIGERSLAHRNLRAPPLTAVFATIDD